MNRNSCIALLAIALLIAPPLFAQPATDFSPANWPEDERNALLQREGNPRTQHEKVESERAIVVGTSHPIAVHAGVLALKAGGTAVDAVLTTALAQTTVNGGYGYSFAGTMVLVTFDAASGKVSSMNAGFNTVQEETDPMTIAVMGTASGRTAMVPGFFAGLEAAHQRFGKLPFAALFEPSIYLAEQGFPVSLGLANAIVKRRDVLSRRPETRAVFTKADGTFYTHGDVFRQPVLASTLRHVAREGSDYIYHGDWAQHFVDAVRADGGKMTLQDLAAYQVIWSEPLHSSYRDFEVYGPGLPVHGGINTLEALNLYEASQKDASKTAQPAHYSESPEGLYWMIKILRAQGMSGMGGIAGQYLGDFDRSPQSLVSKETAGLIWQKMQQPAWAQLEEAMYTARVAASAASDAVVRDANKPKHSAGIVAIDEQGNVAALLHTINAVTWGTTGIFVDGISVPDSASFQQGTIQQIGPGVQLPSGVNPLIVLKNGKPFLGGSSIGSGLHEATVQSLINILEFGMDPSAAINKPQVLRSEWLAAESRRQTVREGIIRKEVLDGVRARGQQIREVPPDGTYLLQGSFIAATIDPLSGKRSAGFLTISFPEGGFDSYIGAAEGY